MLRIEISFPSPFMLRFMFRSPFCLQSSIRQHSGQRKVRAFIHGSPKRFPAADLLLSRRACGFLLRRHQHALKFRSDLQKKGVSKSQETINPPPLRLFPETTPSAPGKARPSGPAKTPRPKSASLSVFPIAQKRRRVWFSSFHTAARLLFIKSKALPARPKTACAAGAAASKWLIN